MFNVPDWDGGKHHETKKMRDEKEKRTEEEEMSEEGTKMKSNKQKHKNPKKGEKNSQEGKQLSRLEGSQKPNNESEREKENTPGTDAEKEPTKLNTSVQRNEEPEKEILTEREQLSQLQRKLTEALLELMSETKNTKKAGKTLNAIEMMTNLTIKLIEENAFNRGKIEGLRETVSRLTTENTSLREELANNEKGKNEQSYADILKKRTTTNQPNEAPTTSQTEQRKSTENEPKDGLLIYSTESADTQHFQTVKTMLRRFTPHELGLTNPEVRPIRGGAIVLSSKRDGLLTLQEEIERNPETKEKFEAKISIKKNPQISILGVDREITNQELKSEITTQNNLEGQPDDIRVIISFDKQETKTHIVEVEPNLLKKLKEKKRLLIGWTSCPVRENIHTPRCSRCCRYGHNERNCQGRIRCSECSGPHHYKQCQGETDEAGQPCPNRCPACTDRNQSDHTNLLTTHSFYDRKCPTLNAEIEKARRKINYA
ncbi:uncharacterized protein ISCGN_007561 [Ixodes scapularis]